MSAETLELVAGWASFILTLFIFSYLLGDNFLYRIAVHLLVGGTAAYIAIVAVDHVLLPWLELMVLDEGENLSPAAQALGIIPFLLSISFVLKLSPRLAPVGNWFMGVIVGVGTGVAIVGAVAGTLIPLVRSTSESFETLAAANALVMVLGTIGTLVYFQYLAKRRADGLITRSAPMRLLALLGQVTIAITFGALYAGVLISSLSIFSSVIAQQLHFLLDRI